MGDNTGVSFHNEDKPPVRVLVVQVVLKTAERTGLSKTERGRDDEAALAEIVGLAEAIDLDIIDCEIVILNRVKAATLLGGGKVDDIAERVEQNDIELVVMDAQLTPGQQRNLERAFKAKVLDRTGLILEIFGRRAQSREGRLQVELAHLNYQKSRLVRSWTHLERQRGGAGFMGGPGETQIEADRRVLQEKITKIERQLAQVVKTRTLHRAGRARVPYPVVALAGYTNAGKSTLFNRLTKSQVLAKDLLFATLDPTMRLVELAHGREVILSDTVGFISDLPTGLVAAFRATLEEVVSADLIIHVRDISHPDTAAQAKDVYEILRELGVNTDQNQVIETWNKADMLDEESYHSQQQIANRDDNAVLMSAVSGEGLDALLDLVEQRLSAGERVYNLELAVEDGEGLAFAYQHGDVLERYDAADLSHIGLEVRFDEKSARRAKKRFGTAMKRRKTDNNDGTYH